MSTERSSSFNLEAPPPGGGCLDVGAICVDGVTVVLTCQDRVIHGELRLEKPNVMGRSIAKVDYIAPRAWKSSHHAAALRVVATWHKLLGGFARVHKRHVCHIVQRLQEGAEERECVAAVKAYATSSWHVRNRAWMDITKFFCADHVQAWAEKGAFSPQEKAAAAREDRKQREGRAHARAAVAWVASLPDADLDRLRAQAIALYRGDVPIGQQRISPRPELATLLATQDPRQNAECANLLFYAVQSRFVGAQSDQQAMLKVPEVFAFKRGEWDR